MGLQVATQVAHRRVALTWILGQRLHENGVDVTAQCVRIYGVGACGLRSMLTHRRAGASGWLFDHGLQ